MMRGEAIKRLAGEFVDRMSASDLAEFTRAKWWEGLALHLATSAHSHGVQIRDLMDAVETRVRGVN